MNGDKVQDSYYFGHNGNLLEDNLERNDVEYYNINKSETYEWNKLMWVGELLLLNIFLVG